MKRPYSLQVAVVILEVHPEQELEDSESEVSPHGIAEAKLVAVDTGRGAVYPEAQYNEYGARQDEVDHVDIPEGEGQSAALQLVSGYDTEPTDDGVDMQNDSKHTSKEQLDKFSKAFGYLQCKGRYWSESVRFGRKILRSDCIPLHKLGRRGRTCRIC